MVVYPTVKAMLGGVIDAALTDSLVSVSMILQECKLCVLVDCSSRSLRKCCVVKDERGQNKAFAKGYNRRSFFSTF